MNGTDHTGYSNLVFVEGGTDEQIIQAMTQWIEMYSEDAKKNFNFKVYKEKKGSHIIEADKNLPNDLFAYLVNYIKYPENISHGVRVTGFTEVKGKEFFSKEKSGEPVMLYIPETDDEYDNVYWVTKENKVYKTDFGGKTASQNLTVAYAAPRIMADSLIDFDIILYAGLKPNKPVISEESSKVQMSKLYIILYLLIIISSLIGLLFINSITLFLKIIFWISFFFYLWLLIDYKMLRVNYYYNLCLALAVSLFLYGMFLGTQNVFFKFTCNHNVFLSTPMLLLLIQKPLRLLFLFLLKREPVPERPSPSFADFIYTAIVFVAPWTIAFSIYDKKWIPFSPF